MFPFIPIAIAVGVGVLVGKILRSDDKSQKKKNSGSGSKHTDYFGVKPKNLVVLGPPESGKTELWCALRGKTRNLSDITNTSNEAIPNFTLKSEDGTEVCVEEGNDIGGTDDYSYLYDKLLKKDSIVYFLLDINRIGSDKYKVQPLSQLKKVLEFFPSTKEKSVKILATHIDEYRGDRLLGEKFVRDYLAPLEVYGYDRTKFNVRLVNLKDATVIRTIEREILVSL